MTRLFERSLKHCLAGRNWLEIWVRRAIGLILLGYGLVDWVRQSRAPEYSRAFYRHFSRLA